jgi:hypothetical protein
MKSLQDPREHAVGRNPPATRYADLETGSIVEMPVMPEGSLRAACAYDQADRTAGNHAV